MYFRKYSTEVELTRNRYPNVKRGNYSQLEQNDVQVFQSILGDTRVLTKADELDGNSTESPIDHKLFKCF